MDVVIARSSQALWRLRFLVVILAMEMVVVSVLVLLLSAAQNGLTPFTVVVWFLAAVALPLGVLSMRGVLEVREGAVRVAWWPLWSRTIPASAVHAAGPVKVSPLGDFGGWGLKIGRAGLGIIAVGYQGVLIEYHWKGKAKRVTVTVDDREELLEAMAGVLGAERVTPEAGRPATAAAGRGAPA